MNLAKLMREQNIPLTRANFIYIKWGCFPYPWTSAHEKKLPLELRRDFDEGKHPRVPAGSPEGGEFTSGGGGGAGKDEKPLDPAVVNVGGDEWNRKTAVRLEREYQKVKPDLEKLALAATGVGGEKKEFTENDWNALDAQQQDQAYAEWKEENKDQFDDDVAAAEFWDALSGVEKAKIAAEHGITVKDEEEEEPEHVPESWDEIGDTKQEEIKNAWFDDTKQNHLDNEIENWYENGGALDDTKYMLAHEGPDHAWVQEALDELHTEREEEREPKIPFTSEQLIAAIEFDNYEGDGQGGNDVEISWDDDKLTAPEGWEEEGPMLFPGIEPIKPSTKLTSEMREAIEKKLVKAFNDEAEKKASDAEPPEYLGENIEEYQDQEWDGMSNKSKFNWAVNHDHIEEPLDAKKTATLDVLDHLPDRFDPLGENDSSKDYKRTKLLGRALSVQRGADVLMARGIFEKRNDALAAVRTFEGRIWSSWKSDSGSADGLILQAATAAELGGRWRNHKSPELTRPDLFQTNKDKWAFAKTTGPYVELAGKTFDTPEEATKFFDEWKAKQPKPAVVASMEKQEASADERFGSAGGWKGVKAYVRSKWEVTQFLLDKAGKPVIDTYRAILLKDKGTEQPVEAKIRDYNMAFHYTKLPDIPLNRNGAQSTSTDVEVCNRWKGVGASAAGLSANDRVVFRMRTPRTAALSVPAYGQNEQSEHELVLAGTAWDKWDAWLQRAPQFEAVPL